MKIVATQSYEGKFMNFDSSFMILLDEGDAYVLYDMFMKDGAGQRSKDVFWKKSDLANPKDFPIAVGKFIPELVALSEPIDVDHVPDYDEAVALLTDYFNRYGERFL